MPASSAPPSRRPSGAASSFRTRLGPDPRRVRLASVILGSTMTGEGHGARTGLEPEATNRRPATPHMSAAPSGIVIRARASVRVQNRERSFVVSSQQSPQNIPGQARKARGSVAATSTAKRATATVKKAGSSAKKADAKTPAKTTAKKAPADSADAKSPASAQAPKGAKKGAAKKATTGKPELAADEIPPTRRRWTRPTPSRPKARRPSSPGTTRRSPRRCARRARTPR